ncbi:MAG TPA: transposase [Armatimonadota bacterium]|nr:transposase [Armatimonadota bacterium]
MTIRYNRKDRSGVLHYLTLAIRERRHAFTRKFFSEMALRTLREQCDSHPAKLIAYVVMPDHIHAIINPRNGSCEQFLSHFKPQVTNAMTSLSSHEGYHAILSWLAMPDGHMQLWQEGKHDFYLYNQRIIWQKIDYIHNNPIRAGLVRSAGQYPYSSFRAWYSGYGEAIVPVDKDFWWDDIPIEDEGN